MIHWTKKMCIEYMVAGKSRLEEIMLEQSQPPAAMQALKMGPRKMPIGQQGGSPEVKAS